MRLKDKEFTVFIDEKAIQDRIRELSGQINEDYRHQSPLLIVILNGAFIFAADLSRGLDMLTQISFIKIQSYIKTKSTGMIRELIGFNENLFKKDVIIVEDIIDSGLTLKYLHDKIAALGPASLEVTTLLLKPESYKSNIPIKYVGFTIPDRFVIGYGLDYDGLGRNLKDIYVLN